MTRQPLPTERALLQGIVAARWGTWAWLTATTILQRNDLDHPLWAASLVALSGAFAIATTAALRARPGLLLERRWALSELTLAWVLLVADGMVFVAGHTHGNGQNLAGTWPLVAILAASTSMAPLTSALGAAVVATGRVFGALANGERNMAHDRWVSFAATAAFYTIAAVVWALVTRRLRVVETEVVTRRARDEVARTLHDGVLQTLALVDRRSRERDPDLAALARTSDRELRAWLYGGSSDDRQGFDARVRHAGDRVAAGYDVPVTVNVLSETEPRPDVADALVGAIGEALVNAAKHAHATRVVVFAEVDPDGSVFASVRDDGCGLDPVVARAAGRGIARSIDERLASVGGRVELARGADGGTEVRLWAS